MLQLSSSGEEGKGQERKGEEEEDKQYQFTIPALWVCYRQLAWLCFPKSPERSEHRRRCCSSVGTRRCQAEEGGSRRSAENYVQALSYSQGFHVYWQRCYPPPYPLLTSFSRSTAGFPWFSVSEGAQLFFYIKRLVHFLVPGLAFRLPGSLC